MESLETFRFLHWINSRTLILQQYKNGLIVEFDSSREVDKVKAKLSDGVFSPVIALEAPTRPYGR